MYSSVTLKSGHGMFARSLVGTCVDVGKRGDRDVGKRGAESDFGEGEDNGCGNQQQTCSSLARDHGEELWKHDGISPEGGLAVYKLYPPRH